MPEPEGCADAREVALFESTRFCAGRRYLSGEDLTGASNEVNDRSGIGEERLISEPGREPMTESSFADGTDVESDDDVDVDGVCAGCLLPPTPPCAVPLGAELVRVSCRRCGVDWNAYGCTGGADVPRYELLF